MNNSAHCYGSCLLIMAAAACSTSRDHERDSPFIPAAQTSAVQQDNPLDSHPRDRVRKRTSLQTIEQVINDAGNVDAWIYSSRLRFTGKYISNDSIAAYENLKSNIKALRIIEEGRLRTEPISVLVRKFIREKMQFYDKAYDAYVRKVNSHESFYLRAYPKREPPKTLKTPRLHPFKIGSKGY
jgi:hypothetical protein